MLNIDLTFTIPVILALSAIVVPSITTILNNRHQFKMRKLELDAERSKDLRFYQQTIYEDYLKYSFQYLYRIKGSDSLYEKYHSLALIYFPDTFLPLVSEIHALIYNFENRSACLSKLQDLSCKIRTTLDRP